MSTRQSNPSLQYSVLVDVVCSALAGYTELHAFIDAGARLIDHALCCSDACPQLSNSTRPFWGRRRLQLCLQMLELLLDSGEAYVRRHIRLQHL